MHRYQYDDGLGGRGATLVSIGNSLLRCLSSPFFERLFSFVRERIQVPVLQDAERPSILHLLREAVQEGAPLPGILRLLLWLQVNQDDVAGGAVAAVDVEEQPVFPLEEKPGPRPFIDDSQGSPTARGFDRCDVDFLHVHHRFEAALGDGGVGVRDCLG